MGSASHAEETEDRANEEGRNQRRRMPVETGGESGGGRSREEKTPEEPAAKRPGRGEEIAADLTAGEGGIVFGCGTPGVSDETRQQDISATAEAEQ